MYIDAEFEIGRASKGQDVSFMNSGGSNGKYSGFSSEFSVHYKLISIHFERNNMYHSFASSRKFAIVNESNKQNLIP